MDEIFLRLKVVGAVSSSDPGSNLSIIFSLNMYFGLQDSSVLSAGVNTGTYLGGVFTLGKPKSRGGGIVAGLLEIFTLLKKST